jgi:hypothetical protein
VLFAKHLKSEALVAQLINASYNFENAGHNESAPQLVDFLNN